MKRYLYILIAFVATIFVGCVKSDVDTADSDDDGKVTFAFTPKLKGSTVQSVNSRAAAGSNWADKENMSKLVGYAFVFGYEPNSDTYGDNSPLLQTIAFKSVDLGLDHEPSIYVTFDEYDEPCILRFVSAMTQEVRDKIEGFTSQKDIDDGKGNQADLTMFADYKHINVSLLAYYQDANNPDPNNLTTNKAFPVASSAINLPNGLNEEEIAVLDKIIYLIPSAAKVDVTSKCDFSLKEVTLLNGAKKGRVRSSLIGDDEITVVKEMHNPTNMGGVAAFKTISAIGNTTAGTPIYILPNNGDGPFDTPLDPADEYPANGTSLSDPVKETNPTYLIIKGRAAGYDVDGYYKIAIVYKPVILGPGAKITGEEQDYYTYNIIRNNHYKVNLLQVDNPGYTSFAEAEAGPANHIAYDITINSGNGSTADTFTDPRAETIVAHNGFFYVELVGSEVFAQGYFGAGVKGSFGLSLNRNPLIDNRYDIPTLYITATDGIVIKDNATIEADNFVGSIEFTATKSGTITLRCGDMLKEIPVHYAETPHVYQSGSTIGGAALSAVSEVVADAGASYSTAMIAPSGAVAANDTYDNREFKGKAYPADMSKGIRKVYVKQASNFDLTTRYDNTADGGISGTNDIFKSVSTSQMRDEYSVDINYQSTGKVYQVNEQNRGELDRDLVMYNWWIGSADVVVKAKGKFTSKFTGTISDTFTTTKNKWSNITDGTEVTLTANGIGNNQGDTYDAAKSKISNSAVLTLTNIAGQTKEYSFNLDQYAAPYIPGLTLKNGIYMWECPVVADCYGSSGWFHNRGVIAKTPTIYNATYKSGNDPWPDSDWSWAEAPTENSYTGKETGLSVLDEGVSVDAVPTTEQAPNATEHYFNVVAKHISYGDRNNNKYQAYFDLRLTNTANELVYLRLRLRREDDSKR